MKKQKETKTFPRFDSDEEVESFVDNVDLSEYDFSDFKPMSFEFAPKNKTLTLRLSDSLLNAVKDDASRHGMPYQRYIRHVLEGSINSNR